METANKRGGKRANSGRKAINKKRTVISFVIDPKRKEELKAKYPGQLNKMFDYWAAGL